VFSLLLSLGFLATSSAKAGPVDDLLPPPVRQVEKRSLGGMDDNYKRAYFDGRGGMGAAFSPDGKLLFTGAGHQGMTLWDVGTGRAVGHFANLSYTEGLAGAFTPDGKHFIGASWGGHRESHPVAVWDVAKRERLRSLDEDVNDTPFSAVAVAPDAKTIALAAGWGRRGGALTVVFWDLASGDEVGHLEGLANAEEARNRGGRVFEALAYSPDGRSLAILLEGRVLLVELATSKLRGEITFAAGPQGQAERQAATFGALAFAPGGRTLAVGCSDGAIRRFDLRTGRELTPLPGHNGAVIALCWARDGKRIHSYGLDGLSFGWRADPGREWQPKAGALSEAALEALWDILRGDDPRDLFGCVQTLAAAPAQAVPFLRKRLSPVPKAATARIEALVADIQKGDYNARKRAVRELRKIGADAAPALRRSQERGGYDELTRRLMFEFANLAPPAEQVRAVRALGVLERIGNAEARKLLEELARGSDEAVLTVHAKSALARFTLAEAAREAPAPEKLWEALADEDSATAYRAVRAAANRPSAAILLRDRLKDVVAKDTFNDDPQRVAKLIADLDSKTFKVRDQASKALRNLGRLVVPSLRKALKEKTGLESRRRLESLLEAAEKATPSPEILRIGRALETLELMDGVEAGQALEALTKVQVKWLREAAAESLRRQRQGNR
jgi:hypothetical protein